MDRLRLGLVLLALAPVAWIVGVFVDGSAAYLLQLAVLFVGLALAAWATPGRRWVSTAGFALAAIGIAWFYGGDLFAGHANRAGALFLLGCLVAAVGAAIASTRVLAVGLVIVALSGAYWVYADATSGASWVWQPGNVLTFAGAVLAALGASTREGDA